MCRGVSSNICRSEPGQGYELGGEGPWVRRHREMEDEGLRRTTDPEGRPSSPREAEPEAQGQGDPTGVQD